MSENINKSNAARTHSKAEDAATEAIGPLAGNFTKAAVENFEEKLVRKRK